MNHDKKSTQLSNMIIFVLFENYKIGHMILKFQESLVCGVTRSNSSD